MVRVAEDHEERIRRRLRETAEATNPGVNWEATLYCRLRANS